MVAEALTLEEAVRKVEEMYKGRIRSSGADKVDIVDMNGDVARSFKVG